MLEHFFSMITGGEAAILLETTRRALGNQSQSKQELRSRWNEYILIYLVNEYILTAEYILIY